MIARYRILCLAHDLYILLVCFTISGVLEDKLQIHMTFQHFGNCTIHTSSILCYNWLGLENRGRKWHWL